MRLVVVGDGDAELGVTATDHDEAHVKRAMVDVSAEVIALATADKLRTISPWFVAPLQDLGYLVTDARDDVTAGYSARGISVVRA